MKTTLQQKIEYCYRAHRFNWSNEKGERWFAVYEYFKRKQALYNQVV